jgi:hypothetical protein
MTQYITELFEAARAPVVEWAGAPLYGLYQFDNVPEEIFIEFLKAKPSPIQGLKLSVDDGVLEIEGVEAQTMLLWHDTAPPKVPVKIISAEGKTPVLKMWNVWRAGRDVTQAWLGNAGMRIEETGNQLLLRCSDGEGPIDFSNLEVRVTLK